MKLVSFTLRFIFLLSYLHSIYILLYIVHCTLYILFYILLYIVHPMLHIVHLGGRGRVGGGGGRVTLSAGGEGFIARKHIECER